MSGNGDNSQTSQRTGATGNNCGMLLGPVLNWPVLGTVLGQYGDNSGIVLGQF